MRAYLYAFTIALAAIPLFAASAENDVAPAKPGTMIGCVRGMKDDPAKRVGLAIFLPATGSGAHAISADQVFNQDNLLNEGGFDTIEVSNGKSELTGKNKLSLKFLGGEIYEGTLQGDVSPASSLWCVISSVPDAKSGFADFSQILNELRRSPSAAQEKSQ